MATDVYEPKSLQKNIRFVDASILKRMNWITLIKEMSKPSNGPVVGNRMWKAIA